MTDKWACPFEPLDIGEYDPHDDTLVIEGTRYSGALFREFGCNFPSMVGQTLRIDKKENGVVTATRIDDETAQK